MKPSEVYAWPPVRTSQYGHDIEPFFYHHLMESDFFGISGENPYARLSVRVYVSNGNGYAEWGFYALYLDGDIPLAIRKYHLDKDLESALYITDEPRFLEAVSYIREFFKTPAGVEVVSADGDLEDLLQLTRYNTVLDFYDPETGTSIRQSNYHLKEKQNG